MLVIIYMYWPLEMLWEWILMNICMRQNSVFYMPLLLYSYPDWADMTHQKTELGLPPLFMLQYILFLVVFLSSPISKFIPNISMFILVVMGLFYMYK